MGTTAGPRPVAPRSAPLALMRRLFDEGFATGNTAIADELCSPDFVEHQFGLASEGAAAIENLKAAIADVHATMPDASFSIEDSAFSDGKIWIRVRVTGTATGPYFGPPSGRPVEMTVIDIARIEDGRLMEHWGVPDRFALLAQTGALGRLETPAPH